MLCPRPPHIGDEGKNPADTMATHGSVLAFIPVRRTGRVTKSIYATTYFVHSVVSQKVPKQQGSRRRVVNNTYLQDANLRKQSVQVKGTYSEGVMKNYS